MDSACSLERGPLCALGSVIHTAHKSSRAYQLMRRNNGSNSSNLFSIKCTNLSSYVNHVHRQVVSCTDAHLGLTAPTFTLMECTEGDRGQALAASPYLRLQIRQKGFPAGRCSCQQCDRVRTFSSFSVLCFGRGQKRCGLLDTGCRRSVHLEKKRIWAKTTLPVVLRYRGQLEASAAQGFRDDQVGKIVYQGFPARGVGKRTQRGGYRHVCEASSQEDKGKTDPDDENSGGASEQNPAPVSKKEDNSLGPLESDTPDSDWRTFRARLVVIEQQSSEASETETSEGKAGGQNDLTGTLPKRWAHPILAPETGCVLIATDKIDGQQSFERSVILLLSPGSTNPREGPYGLILNRPLSCRIKDIKPKDRTLVKFFGNCQVHHGGPLDEDMFLLLHGTEGVRGYREVIPGVYYGAASGLEEIMRGNRPLDYRFFFGYSGWSVDQLKKEVEQGLWSVAACSTDLITGHSAAGLWEEILMLMGGKYAELSKRPRRKHF